MAWARQITNRLCQLLVARLPQRGAQTQVAKPVAMEAAARIILSHRQGRVRKPHLLVPPRILLIQHLPTQLGLREVVQVRGRGICPFSRRNWCTTSGAPSLRTRMRWTGLSGLRRIGGSGTSGRGTERILIINEQTWPGSFVKARCKTQKLRPTCSSISDSGISRRLRPTTHGGCASRSRS